MPSYKIFKRCGRLGQQSITFQVKAYWLNNSGMYSRVKKVRSSGSIFAIELWEIQEKEMAPASDPTVPIHSHSSGKLESAVLRRGAKIKLMPRVRTKGVSVPVPELLVDPYPIVL